MDSVFVPLELCYPPLGHAIVILLVLLDRIGMGLLVHLLLVQLDIFGMGLLVFNMSKTVQSILIGTVELVSPLMWFVQVVQFGTEHTATTFHPVQVEHTKVVVSAFTSPNSVFLPTPGMVLLVWQWEQRLLVLTSRYIMVHLAWM